MNSSRKMCEEGAKTITGNFCISPEFPEIITSKDAKNLVKRFVGSDAEVVEYAIRPYADEKIGYLGSHLRLRITANHLDNRKVNPLTILHFFVKSFPYDVPAQLEYLKDRGVFHQEAFFYEFVVPELLQDFNCEPWAPDCYLIKKDSLVFEDLRQIGFSMTEKLHNEEEIRAGLGALARLHGSSLRAEKRLGRSLNEIYPEAFVERTFLQRGNQYRWYLAGVDLTVRIAEILGLETSRIPETCDRVFGAMRPSRNKQNVASHGDLWSNNLMFDDSRPPRCRLVDFQLARYAPLGHDIAQFLHLCSSREFRESRSLEMIRHYYESLRDCLDCDDDIRVEIPSWKDVRDSYEEQRLGALVTAVFYYPTVLLDGYAGAKIMNDPESYEKFVKHDRRDKVVENMEIDSQYRDRLNEVVRELVEFSLRLDEIPEPS